MLTKATVDLYQSIYFIYQKQDLIMSDDADDYTKKDGKTKVGVIALVLYLSLSDLDFLWSVCLSTNSVGPKQALY